MTFQENLRHYREKAGYAQAKDFAAAIGVKYSTYMAYENLGREPKYDTLRRIAEALNVSIDTLLGFSGVDRFEEYRQLLERSGCHVTESGGKILIALPAEKILSKNNPERELLVNKFGHEWAAHIPQAIFADEASFCTYISGIIADCDNMLSAIKNDFIPYALLRHTIQQDAAILPPSDSE